MKYVISGGCVLKIFIHHAVAKTTIIEQDKTRNCSIYCEVTETHVLYATSTSDCLETGKDSIVSEMTCYVSSGT